MATEESKRVMKWQKENPAKVKKAKEKYEKTEKAKAKHRARQNKYYKKHKEEL